MSSNQDKRYDEEFLGLLQEFDVSADSVLFRAASGKEHRSLARSERLSSRSPDLSNLEKHMLQVHREELRALFTDACFRLFLEDRKSGHMVFPPKINGKWALPMEREAWKARVAQTRAAFPDPDDCSDPLTVLDRLVAGGHDRSPTLLEVAVAGLRVQPSEALTIYRAQGLGSAGDTTTAETLLKEIYAKPCFYANRIVAAESLGRLAAATDRNAAGAAWYRRAAREHEPTRPLGAITWLFLAVQVGSAEEVSLAIRCLSDDVVEENEALQSFCSRKRADRFSGAWSPTPEARKLRLPECRSHAAKILGLFK